MTHLQEEWEHLMLARLEDRFPVFDHVYELDDDLVYVRYGGFGSFVQAVIHLATHGSEIEDSLHIQIIKSAYTDRRRLEQELRRIFQFVEELFQDSDERTRDILNCCIFEALMGSKTAEKVLFQYVSAEIAAYYKSIHW
ncbi:DUF7674 family protein [Paenibacillus bovis]|uniref:DUF7674 domain-containing protein n=1 Tax=Paenibacillus bovis TaxID=1616788 RepID=A0A172ZJC5_9BACL|nr:hypothetical protein [Paenibacillus bovis]ANF97377.1 hypothetical protein AR543_16115 [Paenibacillus bovis]